MLWIQRPSVRINPVTQHLPLHVITSTFLGALGLLQSEIESLQGILLSGDYVLFSIRHLAISTIYDQGVPSEETILPGVGRSLPDPIHTGESGGSRS